MWTQGLKVAGQNNTLHHGLQSVKPTADPCHHSKPKTTAICFLVTNYFWSDQLFLVIAKSQQKVLLWRVQVGPDRL